MVVLGISEIIVQAGCIIPSACYIIYTVGIIIVILYKLKCKYIKGSGKDNDGCVSFLSVFVPTVIYNGKSHNVFKRVIWFAE